MNKKKCGKTIILSTHMMEQAEVMCDRILMINKGMVVLNGKVKDIKNEHRNNSVFLEFDGNKDSARLKASSGMALILRYS